MIFRTSLTVHALAGVSLFMPAAALAQDAGSESQPASLGYEAADRESGSLEDIVVTAQRRSERLQEVPIAVTALSSSALETRGIDSTPGLQAAVPGLVFTQSLNSPTLYLRGVGTTDSSAGSESSVATYIDGIYYPSLPGSVFSLSNIERIEVLKGPQGTLFGRNATGGLVQVITRDPPADFSGKLKLGYANYDTLDGSAYVGGPITPELGIDVALYARDQGKGWGYNSVAGRKSYYLDEKQIRSKLVYSNGGTTAKLSVDYGRVDSDRGGSWTFLPGALGVGGIRSDDPYDPQGEVQGDGYSRQYGASFILEQQVGDVRVTSLSGLRRVKSYLQSDQDATPTRLNLFDFVQYDRSFSQELQIASTGNGPFQWIGGLFFMDRTAGYDRFRLEGSFETVSHQDTRALAAFAEATYEFLPKAEITFGLRYSSDRQTIEGSQTSLTSGAVTIQDARTTFNELSWRAVANYRAQPGLMLYAGYNRGFKSGLYNLITIGPNRLAVRPEIVDAFEGGFKWDVADNRLRINASAFHYIYKNLQMSQATTAGAFSFNAARARVTGGELEVNYRAARGLTFTSGLVYMPDAKYTSFPNAPLSTPLPAGGNVLTRADATGNRMIRTPKLTLNVGANYEIDVGPDLLLFDLGYYYNSGFAIEADNRLSEGSYSTFAASVAYTFSDPQISVRLWARNLTDTRYYDQVSESAFGDRGRPGAPRTYGISIEKSF